MSDVTISPNMNLPVPLVGIDAGPDWATNINACLSIIDQHNHTSGQGEQIPVAGLNINTDLPIGSNNLTEVKTVNFTDQGSSLAGSSPNLGCVYVAGSELYYNDESGNVVQITNGGSVNAGAGSITGLPSGTASASFSAGTFTWQSATSTAANMDGGSVIIREVLANAKGITLSSPSSLAADYSLFFMGALPSSQKIVTIDNSGNIAANYVTDNSTIEISSNTIRVKDLGITTAKIAANAVTRPKLVAVGQQVGNSCGSVGTTTSSTFVFVNATSGSFGVNITTTGRPVMIMIQPDGSGTFGGISSIAGMACQLLRGSTVIYETECTTGGQFPPGVMCLDTPAAGTYGYSAKIKTLSAGNAAGFVRCVLMAYEL